MAINMQELLEDREKGTVGPWRAGCFVVEGGNGWTVADVVSLDGFDQRRIARLPDLEEAYIEAVDTLKKIAEEASVSVDENYPGSWRGVAVERIDLARNFLERNA